MPTGTILGFLSLLHRLLGAAGADPVSHAAAVFDAPGRTFRHDIFPAYKANRGERDPELSVQLPVMREAARALGLASVEVDRYEADDVIATLAHRAAAAGFRVTIVSSDKDMGQLVRDNHIEIVDAHQNKRVLAAQVADKFGVPPALVPDVQALAGDAVDNIEGVPGIGLVLAARLIRKLGSLDAVLAEAAKKTGYRMTAGARLAIKRHAKKIPMYLQLTTLERDIDAALLPTLDELAARPMEVAHLKEMLRALDAVEMFPQIFGVRHTGLSATVPLDSDAYSWHRRALVEYQKKLKSPSYKITLEAPANPQCGWYRRRLVKNGPWVPAKIWRQRAIDFVTERPGNTDELFCTVGDKRINPMDQWGWLLNSPITEAEYEYMMANRAWVKTYAPTEPEANEDQPIDWMKVPI